MVDFDLHRWLTKGACGSTLKEEKNGKRREGKNSSSFVIVFKTCTMNGKRQML